MKERPILFSGPMVRAILDGRKTQTRRVVKVQPPDGCDRLARVMSSTERAQRDKLHWVKVDDTGFGVVASGDRYFDCPYGFPGDRLWVRETWRTAASIDKMWAPTEYAATPSDREAFVGFGGVAGKWRPSIHMPRWASRLTLEVTGVRVERLQGISEEDARAEGVDGPFDGLFTPRVRFESLWESINGAGSWDANPWVWVVEFKRI